MKILQTLINTSFENSQKGYIFYPYGIFCKGYKIKEQTKPKLTTFLKFFYPSVILIIPLCFFINIYAGLISLFTSLAVYHFSIQSLLSEARKVDQKLSYREESLKILDKLGIYGILFLLALSLVCSALLLVYFLTSSLSNWFLILDLFFLISAINWTYVVFLYYNR